MLLWMKINPKRERLRFILPCGCFLIIYSFSWVAHTWRSENTYGNQFSPSIIRFLIKLGSQGLVAALVTPYPLRHFIHPYVLLLVSNEDVSTFIFILCVWVFCLHVGLFAICMPGALRSQEKTLSPWSWNYKMIVSCYVGAENRSQAFWKSRKCSELFGHLSVLTLMF